MWSEGLEKTLRIRIEAGGSGKNFDSLRDVGKIISHEVCRTWKKF
jgi:hypothetical protein